MHYITKDYTTQKGQPIKLHENKIFTVFFNGYYHYLEFNKLAGGAIVIPRFTNGALLLVRLRRAPVFGFSLEFPRGGVELGETTIEGALRELLEETGYRVTSKAVRLLGSIGGDSATINGLSEVFVIDIPDDALCQKYDEAEIDSIVRLSIAELSKLVVDNTIKDGMSLAAFALLLLNP